MRQLCAVAWAAMLLIGCSESSSRLSVRVALDANAAAPAYLQLSVFDSHGERVRDRPLTGAHLPGVLVLGVPDGDQWVRVVVAGGPFPVLGGVKVRVPRGGTAEANLVLHGGADDDSDRDGVPDELDSCIAIADPSQLDSNGDGQGDVCGTDGGSDPDLSGGAADLKPDFLPPPDLRNADLTAPDLAGITTYALRGSVAGLAGGPLVLQTNGADDLTLTANGTFTLNTRLPDNAGYNITIKPGTPAAASGQACVITNNSGTIDNADLTTLSVRCTLTLTANGGAIVSPPVNRCNAPTCPTNDCFPIAPTITVPTAYFDIGTLTVSLNAFTHTYVSDLQVALTHVTTGTRVPLFGRATSCGNEDVNVNGSYRFADGSPTTFCAAVSAIPMGGALAPSSFLACNEAGAAVSLSAQTPLGFRGESVLGGWRLNLIDLVDSDSGNLGSWTVTFSPP